MTVRVSRRFAASCVFAALLCVPRAGAQDLLISLSDPATLAGQAVSDTEILRLAAGGPAQPCLNAAALRVYFGDRNGDGTLDDPNDIDAIDFVDVPGLPMPTGLTFSLLADQAGFKDGDLLHFDPSGPGNVSVVVSEGFLVQALEVVDGNIDVDALAIADDGTIYFSLAEDELLGLAQVVMQDDDVAVLPQGAVKALPFLPGTVFEAAASKALGKNVVIGDLRGLEIDGNDLLFQIQSPSDQDASVFSTKNGGVLVAGFEESKLGFAENVETDALAYAPSQSFPVLAATPAKPISGAMTTLSIRGLTPSQPFVVLAAQALAQGGMSAVFPGFGALVLEPGDPLFLASLANLPALIGVASPTGDGSFLAPAPGATGVPLDVVVQVVELASTNLSNPIVVEINQ
ncbi:MAG: hypothetical protein IPH13_13515 [Planctomycetes bacterium]|nr:hypothetical protein [Planctomycetota bacterium]MCC7170000.1 hypothetical protein [Planctomycetota bacterium]